MIQNIRDVLAEMPVMESLCKDYPTFKRCHICGKEHPDICHFWLYLECDDEDRIPDDPKVLITCRDEKCLNVLNSHPRAYYGLPWGQGEPGHFMLMCGACKYRKGSKCTHPDLKANGGDGLEVYFTNLGFSATVCYGDGSSEHISGYVPQTCEGFKEAPDD